MWDVGPLKCTQDAPLSSRVGGAGVIFDGRGPPQHPPVLAPLDKEQGVSDAGADAYPRRAERLSGPWKAVADPILEGGNIEANVVRRDVRAHENALYWDRSSFATCSASSGSLSKSCENFFFARSRFAGKNSVGQYPSWG